MHIHQTIEGDVVVLAISGKFLGGAYHEHFMGRIRSLVTEGHVDVLLDLTKVQYVDSTGLGSIVSGLTTLKKNSGHLKICSVPDRVDNILEITKMKLVLETFDTCEEALASFRP